MSIIPSPWPICHIPRTVDTTTTDDHGNNPIVDGEPVIRYVMSIMQYGRRGSSREVISPDYLLRTETTLMISVADPENYSPEDLVLIDPEIENGSYVPESGSAYWVDGLDNDERTGPWPNLLAMFGGVVKLRKVT